MTFGHYRLDEQRNVVPVAIESQADLLAWCEQVWGDDANRRVAFTEVSPGVEVSTVFLGIDHRFTGKGPPLVFETMTFDDYGGSDSWRWSTWAEAEAGHRRVVEGLRRAVRAAKRKAGAMKTKADRP